MKIVVAIDSFKGSLSSLEAGAAVKAAALRADPSCQVVVKPLADGGEGTVQAFAGMPGSRLVDLWVQDPLGRPVHAQYCMLDRQTAVMEMAAAAGLTLLSPHERDPMFTSTYGVGEMIRNAIERGCRRFLIGIGGSATNDGGVGMLTALGYAFLDAEDRPIRPGAIGLRDLRRICTDGVMPQLQECTFRIACDVTNPLVGSHGCSAVYGPQKGATQSAVVLMDMWLKDYAKMTTQLFPWADREYPGAGAAGGLGFAFLAYTGAELLSGARLVIQETGLYDEIPDADLVITGEGRLDHQTVMGKAPIAVAQMAKRLGKRVIAFSGCVTDQAEVCNDRGIDAFFPILRGVTTLEEALDPQNASRNLEATAYQVFRLLFHEP